MAGQQPPSKVPGTPPSSDALSCSYDSSRSHRSCGGTSATLQSGSRDGTLQSLGLSNHSQGGGSQYGTRQQPSSQHGSAGSGGRVAAGSSCPQCGGWLLQLTESDNGSPAGGASKNTAQAASGSPALRLALRYSTASEAAQELPAAQPTASAATTVAASSGAGTLPPTQPEPADCEMPDAEASLPSTEAATEAATEAVATELVSGSELQPAPAAADCVAAAAGQPPDHGAAAAAGQLPDHGAATTKQFEPPLTAPTRDSPGAGTADMAIRGDPAERMDVDQAVPQELSLDLSSDEEVIWQESAPFSLTCFSHYAC